MGGALTPRSELCAWNGSSEGEIAVLMLRRKFLDDAVSAYNSAQYRRYVCWPRLPLPGPEHAEVERQVRS